VHLAHQQQPVIDRLIEHAEQQELRGRMALAAPGAAFPDHIPGSVADVAGKVAHVVGVVAGKINLHRRALLVALW